MGARAVDALRIEQETAAVRGSIKEQEIRQPADILGRVGLIRVVVHAPDARVGVVQYPSSAGASASRHWRERSRLFRLP